MERIKNGIVFSNDIKKILSGVNAFDYKYDFIPNSSTIDMVRDDFRDEVVKIFKNVVIISEEEMENVNRFIGGEYPHCYFR